MRKRIQTLWVVDDDELFFFYTNRIAEIEGLASQVKFFKSATSAIDQLKLNKNNYNELPDIILLDIYMPLKSGWDFYQEYTEVSPLLKKDALIYMASCSLNFKDIEKVNMLPGVRGLIVKPLTPEYLRKIVDNCIHHRAIESVAS